MIHHINSSEELQSLLNSTTYVAVDFFADCVPDVLAFAKVNVDHVQDVARTYGVTAMPTFLFFKEGNQVAVNGQAMVRGADPRSLGAAAEKLGGLAQKRVEAAKSSL
ncbi:hypothetical protein MRS44_008532 [Fusarium solani]|uniref:uncharacterized protein n=1 Tax=Fusarium solani TaxID=169388 RepID=UPI0032C40801|nr:hypothetical protein MRS44_008532 [Fusarium solani]